MTQRLFRRAAACLIAFAVVDYAFAQPYPAKPIRLVQAFAAGGGSDLLARLYGQKLQETLGRSVIVDTRPGAGGNLAAEMVARAPADGYTLLFSTNSLAVNATLYPRLTYSPVNDLVPVALGAIVPMVLVIHPVVPARNVKELVALAKNRARGMNFASNGSGTMPHLSGILFSDMAGFKATHVPYKGGSASAVALLGGEVDMAFNGAIVVQPHIRANRLRALAVTTMKPSDALPGVPPLAASYPGFDTNQWFGMLAPAGTPPAIVMRLNEEVRKAQKAPDVIAALARDGAEPGNLTAAEFAEVFRADVSKYARLVKLSGATAE
jgi:tripartite-type tricarboxylate transporter receptor subunit TctC